MIAACGAIVIELMLNIDSSVKKNTCAKVNELGLSAAKIIF